MCNNTHGREEIAITESSLLNVIRINSIIKNLEIRVSFILPFIPKVLYSSPAICRATFNPVQGLLLSESRVYKGCWITEFRTLLVSLNLQELFIFVRFLSLYSLRRSHRLLLLSFLFGLSFGLFL